MNDKELADAVVALGVGKKEHSHYELEYAAARENTSRITGYVKANQFVRDWRVAGELMEECPNGVRTCFDQSWCAQVWPTTDDDDIDADFGEVYKSESLPRAIIEACVAALSTVADKQEES